MRRIENMQDLYDDMKQALRLLGVRFGDMEDVEVRIVDDHIEFSHDNAKISYKLPK